MITKYTSPPMSVEVEGVDITSATVYLTLKQNSTKITLNGTRLTMTYANSNTTITFALTQAESGQFDLISSDINAWAEVQVNYIIGGVRYATEIVKTKIMDNLYNEVIS